VKAHEAMVVVMGAQPPEFRKVIVRDRRTGLLAEVELAPSEAPPIDEGDEGHSYVFRRGEEVEADHPAVLDAPSAFVQVDE
jgi:hypothetical protein